MVQTYRMWQRFSLSSQHLRVSLHGVVGRFVGGAFTDHVVTSAALVADIQEEAGGACPAQREQRWSPVRPALRGGAAARLMCPYGSCARVPLCPSAPAHLEFAVGWNRSVGPATVAAHNKRCNSVRAIPRVFGRGVRTWRTYNGALLSIRSI